MKFDEFLRQIGSLSKRGNAFKPHKYLALLAVIDLVRRGTIHSRQVSYDEEFQSAFSRAFKKFGRSTDRNRPCAPFFHLSGYGFWELIPKSGQAAALAAAKTVGSSGELTKLIDHAELDAEVFAFFQDAKTRELIEQEIVDCLRSGFEYSSDSNAVQEEHAQYSLFAHEKSALEAIGKRAKAYQLGELLANLELHDPQSNRYFEVDLVIIGSSRVFVVELKHWSGRIEIRPNSWLQNGSFYKADPHKANGFKAKLLRGLYERQFPSFPPIYFESVVVLTNPDVQASGQSIPTTTKNNPTFDSIDGFLQYLRHQKDENAALLSRKQCLEFAAYIRNLHTPGAPRDLVFPGYEIVDRLYQYVDRAEVIAKRTDIRHRRLCRLRVFYSRTDLSETERRHARERAFNTLITVSRIGDHPNVLKVWDIPNADGHVVEGSDWSETGTLRDLLDRQGVLPAAQATAITDGLLRGLQAAHQECVVHRSVSPENVLMVNDTPRLMNFDLSYRLEDDRVTVIPDAAQLKRSPYIAPEVYVGGQMPEATADLFSVGVILYEMLTGTRPFECSTDLERTKGMLTTEHRERLQSKETPQNLVDLIFHLVRMDRTQRPVDVDQVLRRLNQGSDAEPIQPDANRRLHPDECSGLYRIESFLTQGAEAQLYRAVGVQGRPVVLKLFDRDVPLQRVVDEQRFAAAIRHPCIPRVESASQWEQDGRYFIPSQWTEGRSLRDEIDGGVRPSLECFRLVADQLLDVVRALHENQDEGQTRPILHNDLKPDNILLADGERPTLIDFGAASEPCVGIYEGTEGYVAPDLRLGQERKYCEDGDLYGLAVTLCQWLTGQRPEECSPAENGLEAPMVAWLQRGAASEAEQRFSSAAEMRQALQEAFARAISSPASPVGDVPAPALSDLGEAIAEGSACETLEPADFPRMEGADPNPFVAYLNSMHSRDATTDNALAEYQSLNRFFPFIHVPHPLAVRIEGILTGAEKRHVIVTGQAGDGKSTIAVELLKRVNQLPFDQPLPRPLHPREDVQVAGTRISVIKDFSEWPPADRAELISEMLDSKGPRFFLVSNTGTMLEAFTTHESAHGNRLEIESMFLGAMLEASPQDIPYQNAALTVINIAMLDNLGIAEQIFRRMIAAERWEPCNSAECRHHCPIFRNVSLIRENEQTVVPRMFLAYRRMHEYGTRLTLRQLCAHLAYLITSGLTFEDISRQGQKASRPLMAEFLFFNRFFGDNGRQTDGPAGQLRAIRAIRDQGFGGQPCPAWERKLWLQTRGKSFQIQASTIPEDVEVLRTIGAGRPDEAMTAAQAREQVRRAIFFLHEPADQEEFDSYLKAFLRSAMLLDFVRWQTQKTEGLSLKDRSLRPKILHVLQEHFTGVRLPEGTNTDQQLYITLSRHSQDVRQSAQVVLARFPEDEFRIRLATSENAAGGWRRELQLERESHRRRLTLPLSLPFLDYVMLRNRGEVGQDLQASFVDRLERFKGQLIGETRFQGGDEIMLVRLRTNHTFQRQMFAVRDGRLEVSDG
jgi:serine/threonine protein kinase